VILLQFHRAIVAQRAQDCCDDDAVKAHFGALRKFGLQRRRQAA
jgi:hypothetical protein